MIVCKYEQIQIPDGCYIKNIRVNQPVYNPHRRRQAYSPSKIVFISFVQLVRPLTLKFLVLIFLIQIITICDTIHRGIGRNSTVTTCKCWVYCLFSLGNGVWVDAMAFAFRFFFFFSSKCWKFSHFQLHLFIHYHISYTIIHKAYYL